VVPEARPAATRLFDSFWLGGFEAACHVNDSGVRLDMIAATQHDVQADGDYERLRRFGICTARDALRWPLIEHGGRFDFATFAPMLAAAARHRIQVVWTLCHYGWPDDVDVFDEAFPRRFARFAGAAAHFVREHSDAPPLYTPINEISFLAWAAGDVAWFHPFARGRGGELKRRLVAAVIAACDAIWAVDRRARIVHVDPVIHVIPPGHRPDLEAPAAAQRASQFEAWDMLAGIRNPELGGHPRYLGVMGLNYYHSNQWEYPEARLRWEDTPRDARWVPFHRLMADVYDRYRQPIFVGETSHFGAGRAAWIREMAAEVHQALAIGVPVEGMCLFPILDRMDWNNPRHWHNSGLWDIVEEQDGRLRRVLNDEYATAVEEVRAARVSVSPGEPIRADVQQPSS
jgi:hypothetical protein